MKKISTFGALVGIVAGVFMIAGSAYAATPVLTLSSTGTGDSVQVSVTGDPNASILMFYVSTNTGAQIASLGTTSANGSFSSTVSSSAYGIAAGSAVYVKTNGLSGAQSATVTWPNVTSSGTFSLTPTSVMLSSGQSSTITASNTSGTLYLSNNSNPSIANVSINSNQITVTALSNGSTVLTICTVGNTSLCASVYVTVQATSSGQALTFSLSNVTVAPGQSVPVTITGGTGTYLTLNNSNSTVIQTNISGSTVTLSTSSTSGSAAITICSSDMQTCGIINATASSVSTVPLTFSPSNPTLSIGQSANVTITGGVAASYYVSTNSNQSAVSTGVSGNVLSLFGNANGTANITVCATSGSCGTVIATVSYVSSGGTMTLSQSSIVLLVGQVLSVTVSGGTSPYNLSPTQSNIAQAGINGNIVTISGLSAGSYTLNICSAGGACVSLPITVNASGAGTPVTFSQSSLNLTPGNVTALTISGSGGYYVSNSSNSSVASVQISGNTGIVTALAAGSSNISICQSGGQCSILTVTVTSSSSASSIPVFSQVNPTVAAGQVLTETISGGASSNYYVLSNTNPSVLSLSINSSTLAMTGLTSGSSIVAICSTSNSCAVTTVTVSGTTASSIAFSTGSLPLGNVGQAYNNVVAVSGGSGSYSFSLVSGSLPDGLTLSTGGVISGTPTQASANTVSIKAIDNTGNSATASFTLVINAGTATPAPTPTPTPAPTTPAAGGTFANGQLIIENGTVYIVYQKTKVGFASADAFVGLGFSFSNITPVTGSGLAVSTKVVITADGAHPRGTWLISGHAVYFLTPQGLIPVPDWNTFLNNGGQPNFIVNANKYDLAFSTLSMMTLNDTRLAQ